MILARNGRSPQNGIEIDVDFGKLFQMKPELLTSASMHQKTSLKTVFYIAVSESLRW